MRSSGYRPRNGQALGREGMKRFIALVHAALPGYQSATEALLAEGDQVASSTPAGARTRARRSSESSRRGRC